MNVDPLPILVVAAICGAICLSLAQWKGIQPTTYVVLGVLLGPIGVVITAVAVVLHKPLSVGDIVKLAIDVETTDGDTMAKGTTAKLLDIDVIDNVPVGKVKIDGENRWVARSVLDRA